MWQQRLEWDEEIVGDSRKVWLDWIQSLSSLARLRIPRHYLHSTEDSNDFELHLFSDASEKAYGTITYLRSINNVGQISISIVASRVGVAPLKRVTLPRLELLGCLLSTRLVPG